MSFNGFSLWKRAASFGVLSVFSALVIQVDAASLDWDNGAGAANTNWNTPTNWSTDVVPVAPDDAVFINGALPPALINADIPTARDLRFGDDGRVGTGAVIQTAGNAAFGGWFRMGITGGSGGTYTLSGGQLTAGRFNIAESAGSTGTVDVSGGTLRQSDVADINNGDTWNRIGQDGAATVNLSGTGLISLDSRTLLGAGGASSLAFNQTGGTFEIRRGEFTLGDSSSNAVYKISAGTLRTLNFSEDGNSGGNITIGEWDNSNTRLEVSGTAVVSAKTNVVIGGGRVDFPNQGTILQSGGTFTFGSNGMLLNNAVPPVLVPRSVGGLNMAASPASTATYTLSGGTLRQNDIDNREDQASWNRIGQNGVANFNISGGTASFDARTLLGSDALSTVTVNQTGGVFEVRRHELIISDLGATTYNISGGRLQVLDAGRPIGVGNWDNSNGKLNISGTAEVVTAQNLFAGGGRVEFPARGEITQTGGTVTVGRELQIGIGANGTGIYNLSNGTLEVGRFFMAQGGDTPTGRGSVGIFNMTGGVFRQRDVANVEDANTWSNISTNVNTTATFNISGGTASFHSRLLINNGGKSATVNQTGGLLEVRDGDLTLGDNTAGAAGAPPAATPNIIYNLSGGTVQTLGAGRQIQVGQWERSNAELNVSATGTMISSGDIIVGNGNPAAGVSGTIGTVKQTGGTVQVGGNLVIAASINATGTYNLGGGVLDLTDGQLNFGQGVAAFNFTGGRLQGANTLNIALTQQGGVFAVGGTLTAGGVTTVNNNYSLQAGGTLAIDISTGVADQLVVNGTVNLGGSLDIVGGSAIPQPGRTIVANDGADPVVGTFAGRANGVPFADDGGVYTVFYNAGDGNDIVLVPEPASVSLLVAGLGMCGLFGRRRRAV
jgi:hypothetical protein